MSDRITITYGRVGNAEPIYVMNVGNEMIVGETVEILFHRYRIREDLLDVILNIAPDKTPLLANLHECQPDEFSVYYEWKTDRLDEGVCAFRSWIIRSLKSTIRAACKIARSNPAGAALERRDGKWAVVEVKTDE